MKCTVGERDETRMIVCVTPRDAVRVRRGQCTRGTRAAPSTSYMYAQLRARVLFLLKLCLA